MMSEDEYKAAASARPFVRYAVIWPKSGVIVQTFVDPSAALFLASVDPDGEAQVIKMMEVEIIDE